MNIDLEKLLELAGKATPATWSTDGHTSVNGDHGLLADTCFAHDAAFIAAANPATVTELVNMVKGSTLACIADVQAEPEFPGDAPPELMKYIRQCIETKDEQHLLHMMRMAVAITKKGIQERIAARTGIAIEGICGRVVRDQCRCGEPISVELDCLRRKHHSRYIGEESFYQAYSNFKQWKRRSALAPGQHICDYCDSVVTRDCDCYGATHWREQAIAALS